MTAEYRIGHGFDAHRFRRGRKLVLGGVTIPFPRGLLGHSDADVLIHALVNALLGAMGAGDIGHHFPDTDRRYKGISSVKLLARVVKLMRTKRFAVVNADITLIAEQPRLAPFLPDMRACVSKLLGIPGERLNLKATTTEGLGWIGSGQGMAAAAVVLLEKKKAQNFRRKLHVTG